MEEWKTIDGTGGMYEVSSYGRICSNIRDVCNGTQKSTRGYGFSRMEGVTL